MEPSAASSDPLPELPPGDLATVLSGLATAAELLEELHERCPCFTYATCVLCAARLIEAARYRALAARLSAC